MVEEPTRTPSTRKSTRSTGRFSNACQSIGASSTLAVRERLADDPRPRRPGRVGDEHAEAARRSAAVVGPGLQVERVPAVDEPARVPAERVGPVRVDREQAAVEVGPAPTSPCAPRAFARTWTTPCTFCPRRTPAVVSSNARLRTLTTMLRVALAPRGPNARSISVCFPFGTPSGFLQPRPPAKASAVVLMVGPERDVTVDERNSTRDPAPSSRPAGTPGP